MDSRLYAETYQKLQEISAFDSDIYMSEQYGEMLKVSNVGTREDNIASLVLMQLVSEEFKENIAQVMNMFKTKVPIYDIHIHFITHVLKRKLGKYSTEEQRAVLIDMTGNVRELLGFAVDAHDCFQMLQIQIKELEAQLAGLISRLSVSVLNGKGRLAFEKEDRSFTFNRDFTFSSGAGACAAYACDAELRRFPEIIGIVSEAAALAADLIHEEMETAKSEDVVNVISVVLLCASAAMNLSLLFAVSLGTDFTITSCAIKEESIVTLSSLTELFVSSLNLFMASLKIGGIARVSDLVMEAISFAQKGCHRKQQPASPLRAETELTATNTLESIASYYSADMNDGIDDYDDGYDNSVYDDEV